MKPQDLFAIEKNLCAALMVHYLLVKYQKRRAAVVQKERQRLFRIETEAK